MKSQKILVVDDEPKNVKLLSAYLKADGYESLSAFNGEDAIRLATLESPDVILLDVMMPDMDGFEVTARLKNSHQTKHIPIVLVTSLDGSANRVKGLNIGADEFLTKPVNRFELIARVRALQRSKKMYEELQDRRNIVASLSDEYFDSNKEKTGILLVEDDEPLTRQIRKVLSAVDIECISVASYAAALERINHEPPDLILLDRLLPDGDGMELVEEIKKNNNYQDTPIIVITALSDLDLKISGIERGADDYLIKPIENAELQARVKAGIRRSLAVKSLKKDLIQAKSSIVTDPLTRIRNRYYLDADLEYRIAKVNRTPDEQLSLLMIDIDYFKKVNDTFGHLVGDKVLCSVVEQISTVARASDVVARFGGEEFCVVLPETDLTEALIVAERIRESVANHDHPYLNNEKITVSIGVTQYNKSDISPTNLLTRTDKALYQAKKSGRNCVCSDESHPPKYNKLT